MFLFTLLIIVIIVLSFFTFKKRRFPEIMKLPGPPPRFLAGNMIDFVGPTSKILLVMQRYTDLYGRILKIHIGPFSVVVLVSDEKLMEHILSSTKQIDKSEQYDHFHSWLNTGLLTSTGRKWKERRRLLTPAFHFAVLENFIDVFNSVTDIFINKLEEHVGESSFDIYPLVSLCALDIICEATMGISVNAQIDGNSEYVRSVKTMCAILTSRNFSPFDPRTYPFTLNYYREKAAVKILHSHTDKVIDERMKSIDTVKEKTGDEHLGIKTKLAFLDLLIQSRIDGAPLSRRDIREEVDTFMFEGHDTTASAVSFTLYCLATNPEVQKKALEEQQQRFGDQKNPKVTMADLQNMKYLELVIKETLRLYPSVPLFGRKLTETFEWDGVVFPRGLDVSLAPFFSHRNPKYFTDPLKFNPERFIDAGEEKHPYVYVPFSAGPRNCIGQKFAMLEVKATVSKVLRHFELHPAHPEHKLELAAEIILISKNGIKISLKRRHY